MKSTVIPHDLSSRAIEGLLPNCSQGRDGVLVADLDSETRLPDEDGGEVLEQQRDGRRGVLRVELAAVTLLLCAPAYAQAPAKTEAELKAARDARYAARKSRVGKR